MFHDDLMLYKNKIYRSSIYLEKCWNLIEEKFIFYLGIVKNPSISIYLESDKITLSISNKEKVFHVETIKKNFYHSLNLCEEFTVSILIDNSKEKDIKNKCSFIYAKKTNRDYDEGCVELEGKYNLSIDKYKEIKNELILSLCLEIQYAINKNIFSYDIDKNTNIIDIDSYYELSCCYSKIKNKDINSSLIELLRNDVISVNIYNNLLLLINLLRKKNV